MTREQIIEMLKPMVAEGAEADKAVVTALLDALHAEIKTHKDAADTAQADAKAAREELGAKADELKALTAKATTADELQKQLDGWKEKYDADTKAAEDKLKAVEFDKLLDAAILTNKPANPKAAALIKKALDVKALQESNNRDADIAAAVSALKADADMAMLFESVNPDAPKPTGQPANVGAPIVTSPNAPDYDAMSDADYFKAKAAEAKA